MPIAHIFVTDGAGIHKAYINDVLLKPECPYPDVYSYEYEVEYGMNVITVVREPVEAKLTLLKLFKRFLRGFLPIDPEFIKTWVNPHHYVDGYSTELNFIETYDQYEIDVTADLNMDIYVSGYDKEIKLDYCSTTRIQQFCGERVNKKAKRKVYFFYVLPVVLLLLAALYGLVKLSMYAFAEGFGALIIIFAPVMLAIIIGILFILFQRE